MPIYEYRCGDCGQTFEKLQKFSDEPLTVCECGKQGKVARLITPPAFHLKGGGWYKDGYGSGSSAKKDSSSASAAKSDSAPAAADSKPAASPASSSSPAESK